jgi:chitinase
LPRGVDAACGATFHCWRSALSFVLAPAPILSPPMPSLARILVALVVIPLLALAASTSPQGRYRLIGYVAGWETFPRIEAEKLTTINFAFAHIADGAVVLDQAGAADFLAKLRGLKSRNPKLKILVSVGGWGADGFSDAALTEASRAKFAQSAAELIARNDLDGIDLDWEYPGLPGPGIVHREEDKHNFTLLLEALRHRFDALGAERHRGNDRYLITAALADGEFVAHIELDRIHEHVDWIDLMTYDFHNSLTPTTGHHAALSVSATSAPGERSVERAVDQFLAAGVPARKLIVGAPFYGRAFAGVRGENRGLDQPYGRYDKDYPWPRLKNEFIDRNGFARYWDDTAKVPYLWNANTRTFVSYDDPQSLALKAAFVKSRKLGGMMYWEQSQDPDGELLDVLARGLR